MKKWIALLLAVALVVFIDLTNVSADELWGKWKYESPQGSITYTFEPGGRGLLSGIDRAKNSSTQTEVFFQFFYVIDTSVVASSSIDSFREYLIKVWFPSQDLTGTMRIFFGKDGKIEVSDNDGRKLILTRIADLPI